MKTLAVFLIGAMMALTNAAAVPAAEPDMEEGEPSVQDVVPEVEGMKGESPFQEDDRVCPGGWSHFNSRCFLYVPTSMTWAYAERHCQSRGGNLASVHSYDEYHFIQSMILNISNRYQQSWLGGSDAQQDGIWLWSDGSRFFSLNWCPGEPNNNEQHCLQMNFGDSRCWDDLWCHEHRPFVCARDI